LDVEENSFAAFHIAVVSPFSVLSPGLWYPPAATGTKPLFGAGTFVWPESFNPQATIEPWAKAGVGASCEVRRETATTAQERIAMDAR
jgi:hypothetical protein